MYGYKPQSFKRRLPTESDTSRKRAAAYSDASATNGSKTGLKSATATYLPEELISQIVNHFSLEQFKDHGIDTFIWIKNNPRRQDHGLKNPERELCIATLVSLSLVSRAMRRISQLLLYEYPPDLFLQIRRRRFIRTISERSDLAASVQYLVHEEENTEEPQAPQDPELLGIYMKLAPRVRIGNKKSFLRALYAGEGDAEWSLLLSLLPNLPALRSSVPDDLDIVLYWTRRLVKQSVTRSIAGACSPLCCLRRLWINYGLPDSPTSPRFLVPLLKIPSLQQIHFEDFFCEGDSQNPSRWAFQSTVQVLSFKDSNPDEDIVGRFLSVCSTLKSFCFTWAITFNPTSPFSVQTIYHHLRKRRSTVEHVELLVDHSAPVWEDAVEDGGRERIGSFNDFSQLKTLKIEGILLTGAPPNLSRDELDREAPIAPDDLDYSAIAESFPESLQNLEIHCEGLSVENLMAWDEREDLENGVRERDVTYLVPLLQRLAQNCMAKKLPRLASLRLCARNSHGRSHFTAVEHLFASASVKVDFQGFVEDDENESNEDNASKDIKVDGYASLPLTPRDIPEPVLAQSAHPSRADQMPASQFDALPMKLLAKILGYFDPSDLLDMPSDPIKSGFAHRDNGIRARLSDLCGLCLVSKRFHDLARPLMYRAFSDTGDRGRRRKFIDCICSKPELAAYVKSIRLLAIASDKTSTDVAGALSRGPFEQYRNLRAKAYSLQAQDGRGKSDWLSDLNRPLGFCQGPEIPILLSQVPNLEVLDLVASRRGIEGFEWMSWYMGQLKRRGQSNSSPVDADGPLSKLRELNVDIACQEIDFTNLEDLLSRVVHLPSLTALRIVRHPQPSSRLPVLGGQYKSGVQSSKLEKLELDVVGPGPDTLRMLVQACKALKHFSCTYSTRDASFEPFGVRGVLDILGFHRNSLESLTLRAVHSMDQLLSIVSLKGFGRLKHLEIAAHYLVGISGYFTKDFMREFVDIFPPSIVTFTINCSAGVPDMFRTWMKSFGNLYHELALPHLRSFSFKGLGQSELYSHEKITMRVGSKLHEAGVAFIINGWDAGRFFEDLKTFQAGELDPDSDTSTDDE